MHVYEYLAEMLEYPGTDFNCRMERCFNVIKEHNESAAICLAIFLEFAQSVNLKKLQENYTVTFDLNPACTLDTGFHIFGESYKRGAFLSGMNSLAQKHKACKNAELPDHLTNVLRLLSVMEEDDQYKELMRLIVSPALKIMLQKIEEKNPYHSIIKTVEIVLRQDHDMSFWEFDAGESPVPQQSADFLNGACPGSGLDRCVPPFGGCGIEIRNSGADKINL